MERCLILHLSDAHIGWPDRRCDENEVLEKLVSDLAVKQDEFARPPDLVVFSGDLVYGTVPGTSIHDQYKRAKKWVDGVLLSLSRDQPPLVLFVPGNHDLDRAKIGDDQQDWLQNCKGEEGVSKVDELFRKESPMWPRIRERQLAWRSFTESMSSVLRVDPDFLTSSHVLWNGAVGVTGLNSSWAGRGGQEDECKLFIGRTNQQRTWETVKHCKFRIVVTHHPVSWLNNAERGWFDKRVQSCYHLYLFGHEHDEWVTDSTKHARVAAGACYEGSTKANGYSWIDIDFSRRSADVHLRQYNSQGAGGWVSHIVPQKTNDKGVWALRSMFIDWTPATGKDDIKLDISPSPTVAVAPSAELRTVDEFIHFLQNELMFRWEPRTFDSSRGPVVLYWPVRLRGPTAIHAVQSFTAVGFQRLGSKVVLCLDDLGNVPHEAFQQLTTSIKRWFKRAGGLYDEVQVHRISALLKNQAAETIWEKIQKWFAEQTHYNLLRVLAVSKLLRPNEPITTDMLEGRKAKRLLTPAVLWTSLAHILNQEPNSRCITLGGYDEHILWKAWHDCMDGGSRAVGHIYNSELLGPDGNPLKMGNDKYVWASVDDIERELDADYRATAGNQFLDQKRMAHWCYAGCAFLPSILKHLTKGQSDERLITPRFGDLNTMRPNELPHHIAREVGKWLL